MPFVGGQYTAADLDYVGSAMANRTGLSYNVTRAWAQREEGCCNNPYGANSYLGSDGKWHNRPYSSIDAGIQAAAALLNGSGYYANVRANRGRSDQAQAYALALSPWGPTGAYFASFPIPVSKSNPPADWNPKGAPASAPSPTPVGPAGPTGPTQSSGGLDGPRLAQILGKSTGDRLTSADIDKLATGWAASGAPNPLGGGVATFRALLHNGLDKYVGTQFSAIPDVAAEVQGAANGAGIVVTAVGASPVSTVAQGAQDAAAVAGDAAVAAVTAILPVILPIVIGGIVLLAAGGLILGGARQAVD